MLCLSAVQDKLRFDPESEIATTGLRVSLICPVCHCPLYIQSFFSFNHPKHNVVITDLNLPFVVFKVVSRICNNHIITKSCDLAMQFIWRSFTVGLGFYFP